MFILVRVKIRNDDGEEEVNPEQGEPFAMCVMVVLEKLLSKGAVPAEG